MFRLKIEHCQLIVFLFASSFDDWEKLVREVTQVIVSKQLVPTMRTQCMRTAFQIPFDATVRVSLDTNLCMITERGYDLQNMTVWHRDKGWELKKNELHRFPHAVLEIKLEMGGGNLTPPKWVKKVFSPNYLGSICSVLDRRCLASSVHYRF